MKAIREIFKYPKGQPRRNYGDVIGIHRASTLYPGLLSAYVVSFWFCYAFFCMWFYAIQEEHQRRLGAWHGFKQARNPKPCLGFRL